MQAQIIWPGSWIVNENSSIRMTSDMPQNKSQDCWMCWCGVGACPCLKCCPLLPSLGQEWSWSRAGRIMRECRHAYAADKEIVVTAGEAAGGWRLLDDWCKSAECVCVCVGMDIAVLETPIMEAVDCGSKKASLFLDYSSCDKTISLLLLLGPLCLFTLSTCLLSVLTLGKY